MRYTETDDIVAIVIDKHSADDYEGFLGLVKLGLNYNSCVSGFCEELNNAMNKHADPKEQVAAHWNAMFVKFTGDCIDQIVIGNPVLKELISNFYNEIGEAMGPVSYAGFELRRYFKDFKPDDVAYQDWVDDCIYYYEQLDFCNYRRHNNVQRLCN